MSVLRYYKEVIPKNSEHSPITDKITLIKDKNELLALLRDKGQTQKNMKKDWG